MSDILSSVAPPKLLRGLRGSFFSGMVKQLSLLFIRDFSSEVGKWKHLGQKRHAGTA